MKQPPNIKLQFIEQANGNFIKNKSEKFSIHYPNGTEKQMVLDYIERKCPDASIIIAYTKDNEVWLRSCVRPACAIRAVKEPEFEFSGNFWELPAGLIDPGETPAEAACRECLEEIGFDVPVSKFELVHVGMGMPSLLAERLYFHSVMVDNGNQVEPTLDGSPLEHMGELICVPINEIMEKIRDGEIVDMKTNLGVRILHDKLFGRT